MKPSKMQQRLATKSWLRDKPSSPAQTEVPTEGHYGRYGWEGPNKADKGLRLGSCNRTACQRPGAYWYNKVMHAWYCSECARGINYAPLPDGTYLCSPDVDAREEYFRKLEAE